MVFKILSGVIGIGLLVVYIGPVAVKLKELPLFAVALIGVGLALADLWQSIRSKDG